VFFPSFIPNNDICSASGESNLYALFYLTGSAYKEAVIGTTAAGSNKTVNRSMALGTGLASQMAVQIGAQGSGGTGGGPSGSGCQGGVIGFVQSSTGAIAQPCAKPALSSWSQYVSWINQRD
jgi:type IV pilus assembly protein PilY1